MMEAAVSGDGSKEPEIAGEAFISKDNETKASDHHHGDEDDEDNEEEGMKSAYSVTDLLDELDSGSDDQVGVCDDDITKQTADSHSSSCVCSGGDEPASHTDENVTASQPPDQDTDYVPCSVQDTDISESVRNTENGDSVQPTSDTKVSIIQRPDTLDREVPMPESVKTSDAELSPEHDYEPIANGSRRGTSVPLSTNPSAGDDDAIYENVQLLNQYDDDEWDSSEFESFEDTEIFNDEERSSQSSSTSSGVLRRHKDRPVLPPRNKKGRRSRSSLSSEMPSASAVFHKMAVRLGSRPKQEETDEDEEDSPMMEVILSMDKHPPPQLSEIPQHLTSLQITRRHIVSSIIESENSYLISLRRIVKDYEKPLLEAKPQILSKSCIKAIFYKVKDILQCHTMFQIELSETIKVWDEEEKIGNVFNASFSKSIVFEVYSGFVNNFSIAMDTAKKQARSKQAFAEFLKYQLENSPDKLSLFGLMVKPVQRFPQFILLLQDLLKKTPQDHHDRLPLQMALTELENLTLRLNEEKRKSESRHDVKRVMGMLSGRFTLKSDTNRYLIRQDDVIQSMTINGETTCKTRRLFMLSDQVLCASIHRKQTESGLVERFRYKWSVPLKEVEVVQSTSKYKVSGCKATLSRFEIPEPPPADHPHKKDLDDLLHDLPMMVQLEQIVSRLRFKYPMLTVQSIHDNVRNLKLLIQHKTDIDQCVLRLSLPNRQLRTSTDRIRDEMSKHIKQAGRIDMDKSRTSSQRTVYSFQMQSPSQKQDWLLELQLAKLALDPSNKPGWYLPEHNSHFTYKLPLYGAVVTIDTTKQEFKLLRRSKKQKVWLHCATPVLLPSDQLDLGTQHLWVCSGDKSHGQITVVALHTGQPSIIETFKSCGTESVCAERVPGLCKEGEVFDDVVWIAAADNKIHVYNVLEDTRQGPKLTIDTKDIVVTMCYHDNCVYAGHQKGNLAIYKRDLDGEWQYKTPSMLSLGDEPVASLLLVGNHVWAACGQHIHVVQEKASPDGKEVKYEQISHKLAQPEEGSIECMVKAGVGLIVSFRNKGFIRLHHFETLEHLQDINMASVARSFLEGKTINTDLKEGLKRLCVTCLLTIRGLLWIGTNIGCLLTLPLPRLEGVPQIRGRPSVSNHTHIGPVKFLTAIQCGLTALHPQTVVNADHATPIDNELDKIAEPSNGDFLPDKRSKRTASSFGECPPKPDGIVSEELTLGSALRNRWISTPDLYLGQGEDRVENLEVLYGSLMRGLDDDFDVEIELPKVKRMSKHVLSNLNAMSNRVTKFSGAMMNRLIQQDSVNKAATLPALHEDGLGNHCSSSSDNVSSGSHHRDSITALGEFPEVTDTSVDINVVHYENADVIRQHEAAQLQNNIQHYQNVRMTQDGKYVQPGADGNLEEVTKSKVMQAPHVHSKALVVLSGGEGRINWNSSKEQGVKSDETCLITWQVPP